MYNKRYYTWRQLHGEIQQNFKLNVQKFSATNSAQ